MEPAPNEPIVESIDGEVFPLEKARKTSKYIFFGGFAFLPLLWLMNVWLFWPDFRDYRGDPVIKHYTKRSAICLAVATALFLPWLIFFPVAGKDLMNPKVYKALDATRFDLSKILGGRAGKVQDS